jgi:hypothetical protein
MIRAQLTVLGHVPTLPAYAPACLDTLAPPPHPCGSGALGLLDVDVSPSELEGYVQTVSREMMEQVGCTVLLYCAAVLHCCTTAVYCAAAPPPRLATS